MPNFLVTTTNHLLAIEPDADEAFIVHSGQGIYYGITTDEQGSYYVACRNATAGPESDIVRAGERGSILIFDNSLSLVGEIISPFPLRDVHGIAHFDNRLWITCSY